MTGAPPVALPSSASAKSAASPLSRIGAWLASSLKQAAAYGVDQVRANPAIAINTAARIATGAAGRLPARLVGPTQRLIEVGSTVALKNAVTPAAPATSAVQSALQRARQVIGR